MKNLVVLSYYSLSPLILCRIQIIEEILDSESKKTTIREFERFAIRCAVQKVLAAQIP